MPLTISSDGLTSQSGIDMQTLRAAWSPWVPESRAESPSRNASAFDPAPVSKGLGELFDWAWQSPNNLAAASLKSVCSAFVRGLRDDGRSPEQVLVAVKREITERGRLHLRPSLCIPMPTERDRSRASAYAQLFHWFLEAYFEQ